MSETIQKKAAEAQAQVLAVAATTLPEPVEEVQPLEAATPEVSTAILTRMGEIDMGDSNSIIRFGSGAQAELQTISQAMLADVRNKDVGPAGDSLRD
uniref:toxic anion resistance protein n=1 Tax=Pseudophaeobacter leonis TaxID=1144477 RepID=UPI0015708F8B